MAKDAYYTIGSVVKVFAVIEQMTKQPKWELAELSRAVGIPKTTVHRFLLTLQDLGYVVQSDEESAYGLTFKLFKMGSLVTGHTSIQDVARPYGKRLLEAIGETVNLCVYSGTEMIVVDRHVTKQALRQDSIVGHSFPMYLSASGKVSLAFMDSMKAGSLLESIRKESDGKIGPAEMADFIKEIEVVRENIIGYDNEEIYQGVCCTAVPVFDCNDDLVATLGVSVPSARFTPSKREVASRELYKAAEQVSLRLGASSYPPVKRK
ncbi:IclR family transcriptional regulator [Maridesulfovibrio ferrireducens]|uniref:IclR family transcriptional regulator n=1 Tax=Maridesulfovibrio ferrireducens TaxID=246191 RepID=UPI001A2932E8|nr:IclR family transcriptional regulator [Maridesulfovibrio ferrireducens]MBI9111071.1 IclR family transcriptional regulator [Maridesulfovibrio ferrireducens]